MSLCPLYFRRLSPLQLANETEYMCFDFFRLKTGPGFAGYFDSSVWSALIIEASFSEPVVLQAVTALGAVHRRFELGISVEAFRYCELADRLYKTARRNWRDRIAHNRDDIKPEIYMVLAKLFGTFETFQDNPNTATQYMTSAFRHLLSHPVQPILKERQPINIVLNTTTLRQYFLKLEHQCAYLFGHSTDVTWAHLSFYGPNFLMPSCFSTIEEARDCLFAEVRHIWSLPAYTTLPHASVQTIHRSHLARLMSWSAAYGEYASINRPTNDRLLKRIGRLLKWYREAAFLQLLLSAQPLSSPDVLGLDESAIISTHSTYSNPSRTFLPNTAHRAHCTCSSSLLAHFARLVLLSDGLITDTGNGHFPLPHTPYEGCSTGIGLHLGSASCRSTDIRSQLQTFLGPLMGQADHRWDKLGVYNVAERVSGFEEEAAERAAEMRVGEGDGEVEGGEELLCRRERGKGWEEMGGKEVKWVDVSYFMERRMLCVAYCKEEGGAEEEVGDGEGSGDEKGFVFCRNWYKLE